MADAPPKWLSQLFGWYAITVLGIGARSGLLDAVLADGGNAEDIAARAGVDTRNALEWLRAMTAAGHLRLTDDRFELAEETRFVFGPGFPVDARAVVDFADRSGELLPDIAEAVRSGSGIDPSRFHAAYGDAVGRINTPTYAQALVGQWIASVPGLPERLSEGGSVADLASGNGAAALMLARAFPAASVRAYDLDVSLTDQTEALAAAEGLAGVTARAAGSGGLEADGPFDLVICLDSFHHLGRPAAVAAEVRAGLKEGGVFLVAESATSGVLSEDSKSPFSVIIYSTGLMYCLQENLAAGGSGQIASDGPGWVTEALTGAGFTQVLSHDSPAGYRIFAAIR